MVLVHGDIRNEPKGKLPPPPEFQSTICFQSESDDIGHQDDLTAEEKSGFA